MTSNASTNCSMVIESKPSAVANVCEQILSGLKDNSFDKDDIFAIHLTLEEAFNNAVKHGNKMDPAKKVAIHYSIDSEKIEISITDEGNGFKPDSIADPRWGEGLLKPGGRGLLLMNSYMDVVKFNERGNSVFMVRYKERPHLTHRKNEI